MGQLTTHVLDTSAGRPGSGIAWTLYRLEDDHSLLCKGITNDDGRNDGPILSGEAFMVGTYELRFEVGDYFRRNDATLGTPAFLDTVVLRFGIQDPGEHYHVPLLVSPYGYSTYRGS
ncbi:MAG TPA: hydroxyisourate hydrolase [Gammaproteobacteria bacterium]|jgi:5-hydroxyisourate hydrolase|nr:hydroxyisourate hydrolase [Gammaproteobacteria bacterium]HBP84824.1 hydroxyisourate hydrolase [Gammaproteobacteria bacterium]HCL94880.1 hydroxyisourate hydrolase [Gammaproteobacteria bacterium]|tara:strand:+ start:604 stop:954 length:351 start_codon:yes stop_codon:yes gene_type:complete